MIITKKHTFTQAAGGQKIGDTHLFNVSDDEAWERAYQRTMDGKYKKNTRNFSREIHGRSCSDGDEPKIFVIPRVRGGESYKKTPLNGADPEDIQYCAISKGYGMQDVSSFTLGPVVGEGLCVVNAAFSKSITIEHIEGGGCFDPSRKSYWRPGKAERKIEYVDENTLSVDGEEYFTHDWLKQNEHLWLAEWEKWRKSIALSSMGNFHWADNSPTVAYKAGDKYMGFVEWKKECYVKPAYDLIKNTKVYEFLYEIFHNKKISLGLVHPKGLKSEPEEPITPQCLTDLFNDPDEMACMPYVVAGVLLNVQV